jgi:hypothetical protein
MTVKSQILESLLNADNLSTSQISEKCGYLKTEIDYIHSQLAKLESEGYFVVKLGKSNHPGRRPKIYKLKRDLKIITLIYKNYQELEEIIRTTDWVLEEISANRFEVQDSQLKNEIKNMLKKSPHFFRLCLENSEIEEIIDRWNIINNVMLPSETVDQEKIIDNTSLLYLKFIDFFAYCVFSDGLYGKIPDDSWKYLNDIRENMRYYHQDITQHFQSYESMNVMLYTLTSIQKIISNEVFVNEKMPWLNWLMNEINRFIVLKERASVIDYRDNQLEDEMIQIYENILKNFEDLNKSE